MRNMRMLAPLLRRLMPGLDVKPVLAELSERISAECDYELEASSHRRLARFWRGHPFIIGPGGRHAAEPPQGAGQRVGRRHRLRRGRPASPIRSATDTRRSSTASSTGPHASSTWRSAIPHPGNYLLCDDGRVAFIDFGMLRELPARLPGPGGGDLRRDPRSATRAKLVEAMRGARVPGGRHRLERLAAARAHARGVVVAAEPTGPIRLGARGHLARQRGPA